MSLITSADAEGYSRICRLLDEQQRRAWSLRLWDEWQRVWFDWCTDPDELAVERQRALARRALARRQRAAGGEAWVRQRLADITAYQRVHPVMVAAGCVVRQLSTGQWRSAREVCLGLNKRYPRWRWSRAKTEQYLEFVHVEMEWAECRVTDGVVSYRLKSF